VNERIRILREQLKLSRVAFGENLGVSGDVINNLERGRVPVKEATIKLICACYGVNDRWLRTGEGEMFAPASVSELNTLAAQFPNVTHETFVLVEKLVNLPKEDRNIVMEFLRGVVNEVRDKPAAADQPPWTEEQHAVWEAEADEFAALARKQFLEEKKRELQASSAGESDGEDGGKLA